MEDSGDIRRGPRKVSHHELLFDRGGGGKEKDLSPVGKTKQGLRKLITAKHRRQG